MAREPDVALLMTASGSLDIFFLDGPCKQHALCGWQNLTCVKYGVYVGTCNL